MNLLVARRRFRYLEAGDLHLDPVRLEANLDQRRQRKRRQLLVSLDDRFLVRQAPSELDDRRLLTQIRLDDLVARLQERCTRLWVGNAWRRNCSWALDSALPLLST